MVLSEASLVQQYGMAGAVIIIVLAFLKYMVSRDKAQADQSDKFLNTMDTMGERHKQALGIIANATRESAKEVSESLHAVCIRLEHCPNREPNGRFSKRKNPNGT
jgi:hypothetical protein